MGLMQSCLLDGTSIKPGESEGQNTTLFARNTADAIKGGALYAMVASIDRVFSDVNAELDDAVSCVLCGGDAPMIKPLLTGSVKYRPDLVLEGLLAMESITEVE